MEENRFSTICPLLAAAAVIAGKHDVGHCLKGRCELWDPEYARCSLAGLGGSA